MKAKYIFFLLMLVSISYAGEKRVLVEILTNSHCPLCVSAYTALNAYLSSNSDKVDVIFYHMPFPYSDDPLYQANTIDATLRNNFYGPFSSTPQAIFNGVLQSNSYSSWASLLENELAENPSFEIELNGNIYENNFRINSNITKLAETSDTDLILNLVVVEDVIYQGRNGISDHGNVMRSLGPGVNDIDIKLNLNEAMNYSTDLNFNALWNAGEIKVVAFIQSKGSKKIYHSQTIEYSSLGVTDIENDINIPLNFELKQNYPNPFNPLTIIEYSVSNVNNLQAAAVLLKIYDVLGSEIKTVVNENQQPGNYRITFDASDLPSGTYFYQLISGGQTLTKKMLLIK